MAHDYERWAESHRRKVFTSSSFLSLSIVERGIPAFSSVVTTFTQKMRVDVGRVSPDGWASLLYSAVPWQYPFFLFHSQPLFTTHVLDRLHYCAFLKGYNSWRLGEQKIFCCSLWKAPLLSLYSFWCRNGHRSLVLWSLPLFYKVNPSLPCQVCGSI